MDPPGLYVHIPFCKTKCPYCDFYSVTDLSALDAWLEALNKEADMYRDVFGIFDSLYLGGGTPSLLDNRQMETLIKMIRRCFAFTNDVEISMEVNPDDVDVEKLKCWHDCGINRISIGVQSFDDDELVFLKRRHSATGAKRSIEHVVSVGFENFGIDLMFGLPSQTEDILISNL
ncbi:MAG TPA: radical SAM protein, partial [Syntrophorhabdaceae bacterium]|nr:radical SAM protein [Syntrophorhabdaceae bacterium]